jgi:cytochrome c peroxidase
MKKKLMVAVIVLVIVALLFPLANILLEPSASDKLSAAAGTDPTFQRCAEVFARKCLVCHGDPEHLPFYSSLPVAQDLIQKDIDLGVASLDMVAALADPAQVSKAEVALAKIEQVLHQGTMPPARYLSLHWNHAVSAEEKEAIAGWIAAVRQTHFATGDAAPEFANSAVQPIPLEHGQDPVKVALGDKLYHDVRLSGDNTLSCASCHDLKKGGTDQKKFSEGIRGQVGDINSPTTFNSGFQFAMFWDGRAADLEEQAAGPVHNPIEMGSNWEEVLPKLNADEAFLAEFKAAYPEGFTGDTIVSAIATFERSLNTPNSRFDKYLRGDGGALSDNEKEGYELFVEFSCATCHVGKALGGRSYEKMGHRADYFADRGNVTKPDQGRFNATGEESDRHKFKVPTLRNIEITAPYFHDASTEDLVEAVEIMARYQSPVPMSRAQAESVAAFLKTLTGEHQGQPLSATQVAVK